MPCNSGHNPSPIARQIGYPAFRSFRAFPVASWLAMSTPSANAAWYSGITGYQWLVLTIASLGWIFDVFEGQVFVASMNEAMPSLLPTGTAEATSKLYNNIALGAFMAGAALGGVT